ncbi:MAG: hypothetical protein QXX17_01125 [Conexivisphaerales archaeon]
MNATLVFDAVLLTLIPFVIGLLFLLKQDFLQAKSKWLYPFVAGVILFLFIDSFKDSASLGGDSRVSEGIIIFIPFVILMLAMPAWKEISKSAAGLASILLLALSLHTAGESAEIVVLLQTATTSQLFSNYIPGFVGFAGHKMIEGFVAAFLLAGLKTSRRDKLLIPLFIIVATSATGAIVALLTLFSSVYFFAAGAAGDLFILAYIFEKGRNILDLQSFWLYLFMLAGFTLIYFLGYLHSIA